METVLQIIENNSKRTGNGSGLSFLEAWENSKMNLQEFTDHVDKLIEENKIVVREGINQRLLFVA